MRTSLYRASRCHSRRKARSRRFSRSTRIYTDTMRRLRLRLRVYRLDRRKITGNRLSPGRVLRLPDGKIHQLGA
jgi:hypothetical protein